jgi:hypothetical protein
MPCLFFHCWFFTFSCFCT